jgi:hypothetical protein
MGRVGSVIGVWGGVDGAGRTGQGAMSVVSGVAELGGSGGLVVGGGQLVFYGAPSA